jgi:hypothetical protein
MKKLLEKDTSTLARNSEPGSKGVSIVMEGSLDTERLWGALLTIIPANEHGHPPYHVQVSSDSLQASCLFTAVKGIGDTVCFR